MKARKLTLYGLIVLAAVTTLAVNGCISHRAPQSRMHETTEWVIPCMFCKTGGFASFGKAGEWAMKEAVKDINSAGGIDGKPLRVEFYNSASDPAQALTQAARMIDTNPVMVMMLDGEPQTRAALPLCVQEKIYALSPCGSGQASLEYMPWNTYFMNNDQNGCSLHDIIWIQREPDIKRVVPICDSTVHFYHMCSRYRGQCLEEIGIEVLDEVTFEQFSTVDFDSVAVAALAQNPDGFIFTSIGDPTAKTIKELYRRGVTEGRRISIHAWADYPELFSIGSGYLEDVYLESFLNINHTGEKWQSIKTRYLESVDNPNWLGMWTGYDMILFAKQAIEGSGITGDRAKLAEERIMIRDWCYNQKGVEFLMGEFDIVDGFRMHPLYLNQIDENNNRILIDTIYATQTHPEGWQ